MRRKKTLSGGITDIPRVYEEEEDVELDWQYTLEPEPENPHEAVILVTRWAISVVNSKTMWLGLFTIVTGLLSLPDVVALFPERYAPAILAVVGFLIMYLRVVTVHPVAFIKPGTTTPVPIASIAPPATPEAMSN